MSDRVGRFGSCVLRRFMDLRYEPAVLAAGVILLLCTQAGFWIDAQNNWGFDPMNNWAVRCCFRSALLCSGFRSCSFFWLRARKARVG